MGHPFKGFGLNQSVPIRNDGLHLPVRFIDAKSLTAYLGRTVRLRMQLVSASVYGLAFS